eukprot:3008029-Ditylum_brightwellii.AAC.1
MKTYHKSRSALTQPQQGSLSRKLNTAAICDNYLEEVTKERAESGLGSGHISLIIRNTRHREE